MFNHVVMAINEVLCVIFTFSLEVTRTLIFFRGIHQTHIKKECDLMLGNCTASPSLQLRGLSFTKILGKVFRVPSNQKVRLR